MQKFNKITMIGLVCSIGSIWAMPEQDLPERPSVVSDESTAAHAQKLEIAQKLAAKLAQRELMSVPTTSAILHPPIATLPVTVSAQVASDKLAENTQTDAPIALGSDGQAVEVGVNVGGAPLKIELKRADSDDKVNVGCCGAKTPKRKEKK